MVSGEGSLASFAIRGIDGKHFAFDHCSKLAGEPIMSWKRINPDDGVLEEHGWLGWTPVDD